VHDQARFFVAERLVGLPAYRHVVEIGGRDINGGVRDLVMRRQGVESYISLDLFEGPGVDVVADATKWSPPGLVDLVICCEVLEHAPDPSGVVSSAVSWLAPGGTLIVTCATDPRAPHSGHDGAGLRAGEYYGNVAPEHLGEWLDALPVLASTYVAPDRGDLYATAVKA